MVCHLNVGGQFFKVQEGDEMLQTQKKYCDYLKDVEAVVEAVGIKNDRLGSLRSSVAAAELLIPVIGAFSAGKSTLINSFLEKDCLPVDITPETALATELHYSVSERLEAVRADGGADRYSLSEFNELKEKASDYRFVRAYLNSEQLKEIQPLVLVDMPGFDAPLAQHNQAILEYIGRGTHYVVLTSVEEGSLTRSILHQISGVYDVNKGISFFLSKSNLRSSTEVEEVTEKITSQLQDYYDESHEVTPVGFDGGKDLSQIIEKIDPEQLVEDLFKDLVLDAYLSCKGEINTRIATLSKSKDENESTVKELERGLSALSRKKDEMQEEAREKYTDVNVGRIVDKVGRELSNSVDELTGIAISSGSDSLNQYIGDMVRHTLLHEVRTSMDELNSQIVTDLSAELKSLDSILSGYSNGGDAWLDRAIESTETLLDKGVDRLGGWNKSILKKKEAEGEDRKNPNAYKALATILGLTTSIVTPAIEIVIIFLPEILSGLMKKHREKVRSEEIHSSILTQIIPGIKSKLRSQIPEIFNENVSVLIEEISTQFENRIQEQRQTITSQQEEMDARSSEINEQINSYSAALETLNTRTNTLVTI